MSMFSGAAANPFFATVRLTNADITGYITSALTKRGYSNVSIAVQYKAAGGGYWDTDSLNATISGTLNGKAETETVTAAQMTDIVIAELQADGHQLKQDGTSKGLGVGYNSMDRGLYADATLLIPRKRA